MKKPFLQGGDRVGLVPIACLLAACSACFGADNSERRISLEMQRMRFQDGLSEPACLQLDKPPVECVDLMLEELGGCNNLDPYGAAQIWNAYAFLRFKRGEYEETITAYENALEQDGLSVEMKASILFSLALVYVEIEHFEAGLVALDSIAELRELQPQESRLREEILSALEQHE